MMVDFKFDALQVCLRREPPEVGGVKKLSKSVYWWVEQYVPTLLRTRRDMIRVFDWSFG